MSKYETDRNQFRRSIIIEALHKSRGNKSAAARSLGMSRMLLASTMKEVGAWEEVQKLCKNLLKKNNPCPMIPGLKTNQYMKQVAEFEIDYLKTHLKQSAGYLRVAARNMGIHRNTMSYQVRKYKLMDYVEKLRDKRRRGWK